MKVAKPDKDDFESVLEFFNAAELALETERYSMSFEENKWEDLDDDDEDYLLIKGIRKDIAEEECMQEKDVDNRILMYEFLKRKFNNGAASGWRRVYWAADILTKTCTDPTEDHLAWQPGVEIKHVENEM